MVAIPAARPRDLRIAVVGGGECDERVAALAESVGRHVAEAGALLVCGGLGGVMEAAARGAHGAGGTVLGILPGYDAEAANRFVHVPIPTGFGHGRNVVVVATGDAVVALPGGPGTRAEMSLAAVLGRPVVSLQGGDSHRDATEIVADPATAARRAVALAERARLERAG